MIFTLLFIFTLLVALILGNGSVLLGRVHLFRDLPDDERKLHKNPTPNTGGLAIGFAFFAGAAFLFFATPEILTSAFRSFLLFFSISAAIILLAGFYDDLFGMGAGLKFLFQITAGAILIAGIDIHFVAEHIRFSEYSYAVRLPMYGVCLLWVVGSCNTMNLIDGIDGLAGSLGIVALFGIMVIGITWVVPDVSFFVIPLAGALLGFLVFNRPPAKVFMGDTGSLFLGFVIASATLILALNAEHWRYSLALVLIMGIPLMDTVFSVIRRLKLNMNPFESDNNHIHHILQRYFKGPGLAVLTMSAAALLLTIIAVLLSNTDNGVLFFTVYGLLFFLFVVIAVVYSVKLNDKSTILLYRPDITDNKENKSSYLKSVPLTNDEIRTRKSGSDN